MTMHYFRLGLIIAVAIVIADQATKWLIVTQVMAPPRSIEVLPFFNVVMVWNRGISFGAFNTGSAAMGWALTGFALLIAAGLLIWLWRAKTGLIATALGDGKPYDFVSRFFAPGLGIPEDPVTGSAHAALTPFWAKRLGRKNLRARQISRRGGDILCTDDGTRATLEGPCALYLTGEIEV